MCFRRALAHWSHEHKDSLLTKHTPISQPQSESRLHMHHPFPVNEHLLAKVTDTHRDHLCNYTSGVLRAQILPFKLLVHSISLSMEARKECRAQHRACCVREMEDAGEMRLLTMGNNTNHTDSWRKQEGNSQSWQGNEQENGQRGDKKYHVTNTCLAATGNGLKETAHQAKRQRRANLN